jgi:hypothetical protein
MWFKRKLLLFLFPAVPVALLVASLPSSAQTERSVSKLADGIYEIQHREGGGGNTTVIIGDRQVLVVDTGFLPSAAREDIAQNPPVDRQARQLRLEHALP